MKSTTAPYPQMHSASSCWEHGKSNARHALVPSWVRSRGSSRRPRFMISEWFPNDWYFLKDHIRICWLPGLKAGEQGRGWNVHLSHFLTACASPNTLHAPLLPLGVACRSWRASSWPCSAPVLGLAPSYCHELGGLGGSSWNYKFITWVFCVINSGFG